MFTRKLTTTSVEIHNLLFKQTFTKQVRSFYTYNVPKDTPRIKLTDGSTLIYRHHPESQTSNTLPNVSFSNGTDRTLSSKLSEETELESTLPPLLHPPKSNHEKIYLADEEIQKARYLRYGNPDLWSVGKLAAKFQCTPETILTYVPDPPEVIKSKKEEYNRWFNNLPWGRKVGAINRMRKKALW